MFNNIGPKRGSPFPAVSPKYTQNIMEFDVCLQVVVQDDGNHLTD